MLKHLVLFLFISLPDRGSLDKSDGTGLIGRKRYCQDLEGEGRFRDSFHFTILISLQFHWSLLRGPGTSVPGPLPETGIKSG